MHSHQHLGKAYREERHIQSIPIHSERISSARICCKANPFGVLIITSTVLLLLVLAGSHALAGSDTWKQFPSTGDWNTAMNWSSDIVPNGPNDTATFVTSIVHGISISNSTEVDGIVFNSGFGATVYTITASPQTVLKISGTGITNNSGTTQHFLTAFDGTRGVITFAGSATAGTSTNF